MERDLFVILNLAAHDQADVALNATNVRLECSQCLKRWLDDMMLGINRPLPCGLSLADVLDYIREYVFPPVSCTYPITVRLAA